VAAPGLEAHDRGPWVERRLPTNLRIIRPTEREVLAHLVEHGYDDDRRFAVRLALEEALVNAMKHGNRLDPGRSVRLAYRVTDECVEIRVADEGNGFTVAGVPDPTRDENLQRPCGRGIMLMRSYMDAVEYSPAGNEVRMVKYRDR
jgi:serine/threonine-protein kinase RsbW